MGIYIFKNTIIYPLPLSDLFIGDRNNTMQYQCQTSLCCLAALNNPLNRIETCESSSGAILMFCTEHTSPNMNNSPIWRQDHYFVSRKAQSLISITLDTEISILSTSSKSLDHLISLQNTNLSEIWMLSNYNPSIVLYCVRIILLYWTISDLHTLKPGHLYITPL